jgi:hypothetical protein
MKKVNWLIEQDIYDRESELLAELQKQGYIYKQTKYLNFCLENETTLVLVSGKRAITKESRFFVYKNQIITDSLSGL